MSHNPDEQFGEPSDEAFEVDMSDVPTEEERYRLPPGEYDAVCVDVEHHTSKSSGKKSYKWTWEVHGQDRMLTVYDYTSLAKAAMWRLSQVTTALGVGGAGSVVKFTPRQVIGKRVRMVLKDDEPYQGKVKSRVDTVMPHPKGATPDDADLPF